MKITHSYPFNLVLIPVVGMICHKNMFELSKHRLSSQLCVLFRIPLSNMRHNSIVKRECHMTSSKMSLHTLVAICEFDALDSAEGKNTLIVPMARFPVAEENR